MDKHIDINAVADIVKDGMTIMVGGFLGCGSPHKIIDILTKSNVSNLTLICNDTGFSDYGIGKMVVAKQFKKIIVSHIGTNAETGRQLNLGETEVILVPQGTLAEQIRAGGAGLGGVLTQTGLGTIVEEGKSKITIMEKEYLLEMPLRADLAIIGGSIVDMQGNVFYNGATRNFNPLMATAADIVIVEAEKIVEIGEIDPSHVITNSIFVDYIVRGER